MKSIFHHLWWPTLKQIFFLFCKDRALTEICEDNTFNGQISILKIALFLGALHSHVAIWLIRKEWFSFADSLRHVEFHKYFYNALWCQVPLKSMSSS